MKNITIAGSVTKDGEVRRTQTGNSVLGFSIAVNGYANGAKTTDYFDVSLWGKRGEQAEQFAKKGAKMCVSGEFSTREYNGKIYLQVNASDFTPMGGSGGNDQGGRYSAPPSNPARSRDLDDEIPF